MAKVAEVNRMARTAKMTKLAEPAKKGHKEQTLPEWLM